MPSPSSRDDLTYQHLGWTFPTLGFVFRVHNAVEHGLEPDDAIRDEARLDSAVHAPLQGAGGVEQYPRLFDKVAALGFRLASGHGFVDGNKRTAMLVVAQTLAWNGNGLTWPEPMQIIVMSLVGAGYLNQEGFLHALIVGYGYSPIEDDIP